MKKATTYYTSQELERLELNYAHTVALLRGGEDVAMDTILQDMESAGLAVDDLPLMEAALKVFPEYRNGIPTPENDAKFAKILEETNYSNGGGIRLLHKFFNFHA